MKKVKERKRENPKYIKMRKIGQLRACGEKESRECEKNEKKNTKRNV